MLNSSGNDGGQIVSPEAITEAFLGLIRFKWLYILLTVFWGSLELLDRAMLFIKGSSDVLIFFLDCIWLYRSRRNCNGHSAVLIQVTGTKLVSIIMCQHASNSPNILSFTILEQRPI